MSGAFGFIVNEYFVSWWDREVGAWGEHMGATEGRGRGGGVPSQAGRRAWYVISTGISWMSRRGRTESWPFSSDSLNAEIASCTM